MPVRPSFFRFSRISFSFFVPLFLIRVNPTEKTIKPASVGGFAGGRKYLKRGILFKFPQVDEYGIYGGVDEVRAIFLFPEYFFVCDC